MIFEVISFIAFAFAYDAYDLLNGFDAHKFNLSQIMSADSAHAEQKFRIPRIWVNANNKENVNV